MKVAELLNQRRQNWQELEVLCGQLAKRRTKTLQAEEVSRFAALYRAACADLALADAYQLPPNTVHYLHLLVGRAHNQLYRTRRFAFAAWSRILLEEVPQRIFQDRCVQVAFGLFWGVFLLSAWLAYAKDVWPQYAEAVLTTSAIEELETNFQNPVDGRDPEAGLMMAGFYIQHNTGIGLKCFAGGLAVIPGVIVTSFNAAFLGAAFGYMARPDVVQGQNFFQFVTAHGPFELTAIVLSAGAGLRLGLAWLLPGRWSRRSSLRKTAVETMPLMGAAMAMFFLAALIEGFVSPSSLPYEIKASVAVVSSGLLSFYFIILGVPRRRSGAV
ncbi:MAG: stage II sporulation protein M [Candidatus Anammoximicrobium sp.]|nr:stage II sporulation protein M [Candidatus Anammoximicrobium sp.]